jgi:hypothetical protein
MVVINGDTGIDTIQDGKVTSSDLATSIALTGTPAAPTAPVGTNTTQIATTAFVQVAKQSNLTLMTSVASTSGTSIDFTGIPSWAKRITIMFNGVSTNGSSGKIVQIGSGSIVTSGYTSSDCYVINSNNSGGANSTAGFLFGGNGAGDIIGGHMIITLLSGNTYISSNVLGFSNATSTFGGGYVTANGVIDRVRITTANGTDTFDAGSINIMYEG